MRYSIYESARGPRSSYTWYDRILDRATRPVPSLEPRQWVRVWNPAEQRDVFVPVHRLPIGPRARPQPRPASWSQYLRGEMGSATREATRASYRYGTAYRRGGAMGIIEAMLRSDNRLVRLAGRQALRRGYGALHPKKLWAWVQANPSLAVRAFVRGQIETWIGDEVADQHARDVDFKSGIGLFDDRSSRRSRGTNVPRGAGVPVDSTNNSGITGSTSSGGHPVPGLDDFHRTKPDDNAHQPDDGDHDNHEVNASHFIHKSGSFRIPPWVQKRHPSLHNF